MSATGSILTNTGALAALNSIGKTSTTNNNLQTQLASGLSINSPADNPAGYIAAQGFTSQLNGITQAISNANQGVNLLQTAQGGISQQINVTQQINAIAVQAANGTETPQEAKSLQAVVTQLVAETASISSNTQFNNINLLDGSFSNVQLQVGANEGQTLNVSIGSTAPGASGLNASTASASGLFNPVLYGSAADGVIEVGAGLYGSFTPGAIGWTSNGGAAGSTAVTQSESAAAIAASINAETSATGISAQAQTQMTLKLTAGNGNVPSNSGFAFTLGSGGATQAISATSAIDLVSQINGGTAKTGVTARLNSASQLVLSQAAGASIQMTSITAGTYVTAGIIGITAGAYPPGSGGVPAAFANANMQGQVTFQSASGFSMTNTVNIGLNTAPTLYSLANIDVSTVTGANSAINVVKFALQNLGSENGQLGAVQQGLTAAISNLNGTSQNTASALGAVQDANIPAVSNSLTQAQIQAQAGVAALKNSTALQQSFLSLLP
jgi:flagellin